MKLYGLHHFIHYERNDLLVASRKKEKLVEYYKNLEADHPLVEPEQVASVDCFYISELEVI